MGSIDESDVIAVYDQWRTAFQAVDGDAMKRLFDQGSDGLIYQSEENADPMYTWAEIDAYWSGAPEIVDRIPEWRELGRKIAILDDTAFVYAKLQTHLEIIGAKRPLLGELRVSIGLHRKDSDWKIVHYHESRHVDLTFLFED
ncbi:MAG TPA: DUF4440 domain-containing protein [Gammaproteobacteria bacterium]|nr:DUF4440 domain-containing protein [Gammaproteobacteria bacterium]|tara:strand:- start:75 stop:503 length:429 start_codon:yes stop_codon:yes gene_type:complete